MHLLQLSKKTQDILPFFQDFVSIFQTFSRSGKLLGKYQDFYKNSRLCGKTVRQMCFTESIAITIVTTICEL